MALRTSKKSIRMGIILIIHISHTIQVVNSSHSNEASGTAAVEYPYPRLLAGVASFHRSSCHSPLRHLICTDAVVDIPIMIHITGSTLPFPVVPGSRDGITNVSVRISRKICIQWHSSRSTPDTIPTDGLSSSLQLRTILTIDDERWSHRQKQTQSSKVMDN